jgi:hypothetical protein
MVTSNSVFTDSYYNEDIGRLFVTINLEEELENQFPITVLLKKWLPYDMLVFSSGRGK